MLALLTNLGRLALSPSVDPLVDGQFESLSQLSIEATRESRDWENKGGRMDGPVASALCGRSLALLEPEELLTPSLVCCFRLDTSGLTGAPNIPRCCSAA